ncbi:uncharacterized protein [Vicugna pacos]|uniref:Translation initiation factor IF-2-like n=1 Tax=Vicugna pacos TaxID=30538 RepID=A0ABM5DNH1_VICPA
MPSEEGGAGGSEIVKLCLGCARRCAALALPGRTREGARPRGARAPPPPSRVLVGARVPRRHQRGAPGGRPGLPARTRRLPGALRGAGRGRGRGRGGRREGPRLLQPRAAVRLHVTATQNRARPRSGILRVWEVSASSVPTAGAGGAPLTRGPVAAEELSSPPRDSEGMARPPRRGHVAAPELLVFPGGTTLVFLSEAAISILFWLIQALSGPRCGDRGWASALVSAWQWDRGCGV